MSTISEEDRGKEIEENGKRRQDRDERPERPFHCLLKLVKSLIEHTDE